MQAKLPPGDNFHGFIKRAKPARHDDESISDFVHHIFAFMHCINDMQIVQAAMRNFYIIKEFRDNPGCMPVCGNDCIGNFAHQAAFAAAIHQSEIARRQNLAKLMRGVSKSWIAACGGAGKNT